MLNKRIQARQTKGIAHIALMGAIAIPLVASSFVTTSIASAQSTRRAVVFAPPSNVRAVPNGQVICSVRSATSINVYSYSNGWYETDYCGDWGYIHQSQVQLQQPNQVRQSSNLCDVINIQRGQLALRFTPNGKSRAGLNNGNTVRHFQQQGIWSYVQVIYGPNAQVNGLEGWVNSNYLTCY
ncbi:MAG: SH3 domain-containing protein [Waterburya sp.]